MPWADLLALAHRYLNIAPEAFWQLSVAEWNCLMNDKTTAGVSGMSRSDFDQLAASFPDTQSTEAS